MIYGVSKSKGGGFGYSQKSKNPRNGTLIEPTKPSSSIHAQKGLDSYFVSPSKKVKVLKQVIT